MRIAPRPGGGPGSKGPKIRDIDFSRVVKATVYLSDIKKFAEFNKVYGEYFPSERSPARSAFQVAALPLSAKPFPGRSRF